MKKLIIALALCSPGLVFAGSVYKCETSTGTVYQESPCPSGAKKLAAACINSADYYSANKGEIKFDGESCEAKNQKRQVALDAEKSKKEEEKELNAIKRRDAFIKATMPKKYTASFDDCVANSDSVSTLADGRVINIVDTNMLKVTKFCSSYGPTIITCSRETGKMVISASGNEGCN